jgi:D-glycero-D-manno-heptose 1,7-bisphosphate phosphatase
MSQKTPAVFFDRDGTLMKEVNYCSDPEKVAVFPGVTESLRRLRAAGFKIVIITNQSGIGRGYYTEEQYHAVHAELIRQIGDGLIDATYYCPAAPEAKSPRRKPLPGMVHEAEAEQQIDLARSFFVGDKAADIQCGRNCSMRGSILVETGYGADSAECQPDFVAKDIPAATDYILANAQ